MYRIQNAPLVSTTSVRNVSFHGKYSAPQSCTLVGTTVASKPKFKRLNKCSYNSPVSYCMKILSAVLQLLRAYTDGPTDGPFEQAIGGDGNTRESPMAAAHATNLAAPLGYRPQYRNKTNTPHITVAISRVNDTTSTVLSVALAFFTQQFICEDIFHLRHSMLSQW